MPEPGDILNLVLATGQWAILRRLRERILAPGQPIADSSVHRLPELTGLVGAVW
jgi:hypothetical protein